MMDATFLWRCWGSNYASAILCLSANLTVFEQLNIFRDQDAENNAYDAKLPMMCTRQSVGIDNPVFT